MTAVHWQPSAAIPLLKQRARILAQIRDFFNGRGYLEVETPIMAHYGITDVYLSNIKASFRGELYCLQTSPEYHMKRLLAAGSGPIFQIGKSFRDDELGRWHNPEFTMLEWYQLGINHHQLMDEMDALLQLVLRCPPIIRKSYRQVFEEQCQLNPHTATITELRQLLIRYQLDYVIPEDETDRDQYLFLLMSHVIEPAYAEQAAPLAVYDFPQSQAALAKVNNQLAERFEIYFKGIELANGFHELTEMQAQAARFQQDIALRQEKGMAPVEADKFLLAALEHGLPSCSGVALGIDRLLMIALGQERIEQVMSFNLERA
ncbi:elongation factor P--(R)-beta-lysine ligase [Legionella dresdenensis]|uniref:Elongation factor P--(R)-beta-lysine ligase n=1 Tax=Legionella dresdenensis TaxID=450200 RepID=A0ABV8CGR1_9GAMM